MTSTNIFEGSRVRLRGVEPGDWETFQEWDHDSENSRRSSFIAFPRSVASMQQWVDEQAKKDAENDSYRFQIETLDQVMVGTIIAVDCNARMGTFSYGLGVMDEHRRKGYASEAILLLLRYYFLELRYQKCTTSVYDFNPPSIGLHEKLGFMREGTLRNMIFTAGQHHDIHYYGITRTEFEAEHPDYVYGIAEL